MMFLSVVFAGLAAYTALTNMSYVTPPVVGSSSFVTATPQEVSVAAESSPPPSPTPPPTTDAAPAPTPTPSPTPDCTSEWTFEGATLSIPSIGLDNRSLSEYTSDDLVEETFVSPSGETVTVSDTIVPEGRDTIAWYSSLDGSILSACATDTVYLYGHSYGRGEEGAFNQVPSLAVGDLVVVQTDTERLTYQMLPAESGDGTSNLVQSVGLGESAVYTKAQAGRLTFVTCSLTGGYVNGRGVYVSVSAAQLVKSEYLAAPAAEPGVAPLPATPEASQGFDRLADHPR